MSLFQENVVCKEIYDKPDPIKYFGKNNTLNIVKGVHNHWNKHSNLQIYINQHKMAQVISKVVDNYDYFILIRSDSTILFPFPDKSIFEKLTPAMYFIDAKYSKHWGDIGMPAFIHKNYILHYLNSYYNIISNNWYIPKIMKILKAENLVLRVSH